MSPPTESREILKMKLSELTDTYKVLSLQSSIYLLRWYLLTLTSRILEYKLLQIYSGVTEELD